MNTLNTSLPTTTEIGCPNCGSAIPITDLLIGPLRAQIAAKLRPQLLQEAQDAAAAKLESLEDHLGEVIAEKEELVAENKELKRQELSLRKDREALAQKQEDFDLAVQRELARGRGEIRKEERARTVVEYELVLREKEERNRRLQLDIERLRQRAAQSPPELQGTVQEQALDERISAKFPEDHIRRVARGRSGADVVQRVQSASGAVIGTILWESKRARTFGKDWISTLKENARRERADVAVLVSSVLPEGAQIAGRDGVWMVSLHLADSVAEILRAGLLAAAHARTAAERRDGLAGQVYDYVTSHRFGDPVISALEQIHKEMQALDKERRVQECRWAEREELLRSQAGRWATVVGELQGIGAKLVHIPALELPQGD
jgi:hypothetical protein